MLIDTHAHLTDGEFGGAKDIIDNMKADGLERIISVGYDLESSEGSLKLSEQNQAVYCAVGYHPSEIGRMTDDGLEKLFALSKNEKCVAIGEIGLDYHYPDTNKPVQHDGLDKMFELAENSGLPVIFHIREADGDMLKKVKDNIGKFKAGGVVHCFSGSKETALEYIKLGFYVSFTGVISFRNAEKFPEIIKALPRDRILIETDCPYLAPPPHRGEINYPKYVKYQAERIADILGEKVGEVERFTTENAYRLFAKMKRA